METLNKPVYHFNRKGRYRDKPPRKLDIYDGIL